MQKKVFIISVNLILYSCFLNAQYPDVITRINGKSFNCRIIAIDSAKIDLFLSHSDKEIKSLVYLEDISSYVYRGKQVHLQEVVISTDPPVTGKAQQTTGVSPNPDKKKEKAYKLPKQHQPAPDWKKCGYQLHTDGQPRSVLRLSCLAPGLLMESRLSESATLNINFWLGVAYQFGVINGESYSNIMIQPNFSISPRWYLNLDKRASWGRRVDYYSGPYITTPGRLSVTGGGLAGQLAVEYGFQRTLCKKGYWNISAGIGLTSLNGVTRLGLTGDFSLGFILSK